MPERRPPVRVELVSHAAREQAAAGALSLLFVAVAVGVQWWATTPAAERTVKLRKIGVVRCRAGRWHFRGVPVQWPPGRCLCSWPTDPDPASQLAADLAEGRGEARTQ